MASTGRVGDLEHVGGEEELEHPARAPAVAVGGRGRPAVEERRRGEHARVRDRAHVRVPRVTCASWNSL